MIGITNPYIFNYVPAGLIIPYYTADAVPSGWVLFSSADDKYITGADSGDADYTVGTHAGTSATFDVTSEQTGGHYGDEETVAYSNGTVGDDVYKRANTEILARDGIHSHTITYTPTLGYEEMRFIKALSNLDKFPANSLVLTDEIISPPSGVTQQIVVASASEGRFLKANTAIASAYTSVSPACSTSGDHTHNWAQPANTAFDSPVSTARRVAALMSGYKTGDHTHTFTNSAIEENILKVYLSAWTNASVDFKGFSGIIAMWESFTPPPGWVLCDGTNGTKNLKKRFVIFGPNASVGQYAGNGTVTFTSTLDNDDFTHSHMDDEPYNAASVVGNYTNVNHDTESVSHTHTVDASTVDFLPDYYSLVFIQKL